MKNIFKEMHKQINSNDLQKLIDVENNVEEFHNDIFVLLEKVVQVVNVEGYDRSEVVQEFLIFEFLPRLNEYRDKLKY